jgi:hypothetical protein
MRRIATFGGVVGLAGTGSGYAFGDAPLGALVVLAALALALLGIGAWAAGVLPSLPARVRRSRRRVAVPAVAIAVLLSVSVAPVAGDHGGGHYGFQGCDNSDSLIGAFLDGFASPNEEGECRFNPDDGPDQSDYADLQAMAEVQHQSTEDFLRITDNFAKDTRAVAWSDAKLSLADSLNNGSNLTEAKKAWNESVMDYYGPKYKDAYNQYSKISSTTEYIWKADSANVTWSNSEIVGWVTVNVGKYDHGGTTTYENITVRSPVLSDGAGGYHAWAGFTKIYTSNVTYSNFYLPQEDNSTTNIEIRNTNSITWYNATGSTYLQWSDSSDAAAQWNQQASQVKNSGMPYVEEVYNKYKSGEINSTDILGASELAGRASTSYNSTGYYGFAAVEMATLGWESDLNTSFSVGMNGTTYDGYVFYSGDEQITFQNGTEYDPSSYNGSFYMTAQTSNGSKVLPLDQNFTVNRLTDPTTGEALNETTTESYTYAGGNASEFQSELESLAQLRAQLKKQESASAGGGGFDFGGAASTGGILLAAGVALYALGRSED